MHTQAGLCLSSFFLCARVCVFKKATHTRAHTKKTKIFENVFHGNYVIFHGLMPLLKESLNALICIEIVIICSFQGENCIF